MCIFSILSKTHVGCGVVESDLCFQDTWNSRTLFSWFFLIPNTSLAESESSYDPPVSYAFYRLSNGTIWWFYFSFSYFFLFNFFSDNSIYFFFWLNDPHWNSLIYFLGVGDWVLFGDSPLTSLLLTYLLSNSSTIYYTYLRLDRGSHVFYPSYPTHLTRYSTLSFSILLSRISSTM